MLARRPPESEEVSTVLKPQVDLANGVASTFELVVIEGPNQGMRQVLEASSPSRILVGQGPACDIQLGDREVSRRHLSLDVVGRRVRITDLGSRNGTFVDGVAVMDGYLVGGEVVRIGSSAFQVISTGQSKSKLPTAIRFGRVFGGSPEMRRLYPLCEKLASSSVPVVIEGETGTGKEALAEALHEAGPRASGPFVVFDCTAVPPNLVESELFGHERGAFTGAVATRKGVFEAANHGTLLIDEIGDLDITLQPKLLRVLERAEVRRVGASKSIHVDVRILAATRRDLDQEVAAGRFRDDLFHRLTVTRIELPPLRQRTGDVALLATHFWKELAGPHTRPPAAILERWENYSWPGNVRELRNAVARHLALGELASGELGQSPQTIPQTQPSASPGSDPIAEVLALGLPFPLARQRVVEIFERRFVMGLLERHGGNVAKAAQDSGVARRYFQLIKARQKRP